MFAMQQFSFDFSDPVFDIDGWRLSAQVITFENTYGLPPSERGADPPVSEFCRTTKSITFVDSMVIFEKGDNPPRHREIR